MVEVAHGKISLRRSLKLWICRENACSFICLKFDIFFRFLEVSAHNKMDARDWVNK